MDGELRDALRGRGIPRGQRPRPVLDRFDHLPWPVRHRGGRLRHHGNGNGQHALLGRRAHVLLVHRVSGAERRAHSARPRQGVYLLVADLSDAQARSRVRACRRQVQLSVRVPGDFRQHDCRRRGVRRRGLCARSADNCPAALLLQAAAQPLSQIRRAADGRFHLGRAAQPDRQVPRCRLLRRCALRLLFDQQLDRERPVHHDFGRHHARRIPGGAARVARWR